MKKNLVILISLILGAFAFFSCGSSNSDSDQSNESSYEDDRLAEYAGKWELFQQGEQLGDNATFTLVIHKSGSAEVEHIASGFGYSKTIDKGSGQAFISGNTLTVEITDGVSRGNVYQFKANNGDLYLPDGVRLRKKLY